jgi:RNA polymerase sigma-70 factor (ECF subfamily)
MALQFHAAMNNPEAVAAGRSDQEIITEVLNHDPQAFELLLRRYNARVYRVARSIVRDDDEAEDIAQESWVRAYTNLARFAGAASFSTWISKIAAHEAFLRLRRRARVSALPSPPHAREPAGDPEKRAFGNELRRAIEKALDDLPTQHRSVFVLRCIDRLSVSETAAVLGLSQDVVKARLHRARGMLQRSIGSQVGRLPPDLYRFPAPRCDRLAAAVHRRLGFAPPRLLVNSL